MNTATRNANPATATIDRLARKIIADAIQVADESGECELAIDLFRVAAVVRNDWKPGTPNEIERMMDVTDDALIIAGDDPDPYAEPAYRKAYNLVRAIARRYAETA